MRVLMVNDYPPGEGWGAEIHLARLIAGLQASGDTTASFSPAKGRTGMAKALDVWDPSARHQLRQMATDFRPDVVHVHNFQRELSASVLGAIPSVPRVLSTHDHRLFGEEVGDETGGGRTFRVARDLKARFERAVARRTMHVVTAPSMDLVGRLQRAGFEEVHHIPYFLDAGPEPAAPPSASEEIVFAGRVSEDKGVTDLLAAFELIAERYPVARLTIAGDGEQLDRISSSVAASVASRVEFVGRLDAVGVREIMGRARVVCIPSRKREGSPISAIEAALSGRPVVVSDDPGLKELVGEAQYGIVVPRFDVGQLGRGLDTLLSDTALADRLGVAGRGYAMDHWSTEAAIELTQRAYERAVARMQSARGDLEPFDH